MATVVAAGGADKQSRLRVRVVRMDYNIWHYEGQCRDNVPI